MYKNSAFPLIAGTIIVYDQQSTNNTLLGTLVDANDDKKMVLLGIIGSVFRQCWSNVGVNFFFWGFVPGLIHHPLPLRRRTQKTKSSLGMHSCKHRRPFQILQVYILYTCTIIKQSRIRIWRSELGDAKLDPPFASPINHHPRAQQQTSSILLNFRKSSILP